MASNPLMEALARVRYRVPWGGTVLEATAPMSAPTPATSPSTVLPGAQQGGIRSVDDAKDIAKRGAADATLSNLGRSFNLGMGLMGGMSALTTGLKGLAAMAGAPVDNPFKDLSGFAKPNASQLGTITSSNPIEARAQARRATEAAHADRKAREKKAREFAQAQSDRGRRGIGRGGGFSGSRGEPGSSRGSRGE